MQAHTVGEVGNLGTVSLRVYSGTVLPIFIEIGLYLADKKQNMLAQFFLRDGVYTVYAFFGDTPTGQTPRRIFTRDRSNDAVSGKGVPFGG